MKLVLMLPTLMLRTIANYLLVQPVSRTASATPIFYLRVVVLARASSTRALRNSNHQNL